MFFDFFWLSFLIFFLKIVKSQQPLLDFCHLTIFFKMMNPLAILLLRNRKWTKNLRTDSVSVVRARIHKRLQIDFVFKNPRWRLHELILIQLKLGFWFWIPSTSREKYTTLHSENILVTWKGWIWKFLWLLCPFYEPQT